MKIIIDDKIPFIKGRLEPFAEVTYAPPGEIDAKLVSDADILVVRTRTRCDRELLDGSAVKLVATATIGTDHIDLGWCRDNGIAVMNAAGCNAPGVAQYVWSSLLRNGFDPSSSIIGVVGYGNVGSVVADWGRKLGATVMVCDPLRKEMGMTDVEYLPLHQLLQMADAVTIHTPLTRGGAHPTFHMIGERELAMMKPGAILANTSRGPVADNAAWLSHILRHDAKAIIDTWEGEPDISRELLGRAIVATPHIAGYSLEGKQRATRMSLENIARHFGLPVDTSGLAPAFRSPAAMTPQEIVESYDPGADTELLRTDPSGFERLRGDYDHRPEPAFRHNPYK